MEKNEIIAKFATHEGDTGSPEVQIALLEDAQARQPLPSRPFENGR